MGRVARLPVVLAAALCGVAGMGVLSALALPTGLRDRIVLSGAAAAGVLLVLRLVVLLFDRQSLLRSRGESVGEVEEAEGAIGRFIGTVSHDLRSPLASISGYAELLREPDVLRDPVQVSEITRSIERNARRLTRLTEDLLCAGQFAAGHPPALKLVPVDLRRAAEEAMRDIGHADSVPVHGPRWVYALADRQRVQQVLVNLVENALERSGSSEVWITIESGLAGPVLRVSDHGAGIPAERLATLFGPFVMGSRSSSRTGLGLFVVHELVEAMSGCITVDSEVGQGTTFSIDLPVAAPETASAGASTGRRATD